MRQSVRCFLFIEKLVFGMSIVLLHLLMRILYYVSSPQKIYYKVYARVLFNDS